MTRGECPEHPHSLFYTAKFLTLCTPLSFYWVKGYWIKFVDPTGSPSLLSRSWVFSHSLVILYQIPTTMSSYFRSFFINCEHPRSSTSYHLWPLFVWPCVFLLWPQCYCPHSSLVDTSFGCNQRLSLYVSSSIHVVRFGRSGKESNLTQPMV